MIIKDIKFKLKDGRTAILRSANEKDAKALIEYMKKSTGETDFLLRTPEECETQTIEQEIDFINSCNLSDTHTLLVCEVDGKIAGNCMVWWNKRAKTGHRANVAIGLLSEFWNQGIGTRMFWEMIKKQKAIRIYCRWNWILLRAIAGREHFMRRWASG